MITLGNASQKLKYDGINGFTRIRFRKVLRFSVKRSIYWHFPLLIRNNNFKKVLKVFFLSQVKFSVRKNKATSIPCGNSWNFCFIIISIVLCISFLSPFFPSISSLWKRFIRQSHCMSAKQKRIACSERHAIILNYLLIVHYYMHKVADHWQCLHWIFVYYHHVSIYT